MIEALAVAVHAVGAAPPAADDRVAVIGCGMIGLLTIQVLRAAASVRIVAADLDAGRLALATRGGRGAALLDRVCQDDPPTITHSTAVADVFEAVGRSETVAAAIRASARAAP